MTHRLNPSTTVLLKITSEFWLNMNKLFESMNDRCVIIEVLSMVIVDTRDGKKKVMSPQLRDRA